MNASFLVTSAAALLCLSLSAGGTAWTDVYELEDIALPEGAPPEVGDLAFAPDGSLFVCLRRGDVLKARPTADPSAFEWTLFATGFHNGCGMWAPSPDTVVVSQMAELTEAIDKDGDGTADTYNCLTNGWGMSGNYHETNALWPDGFGGYWLAVGTASHNGPTFHRTRGVYSPVGRRGRNFSSVRYRGWVMHYNPSTKQLTPFCSGFRMHNGIFQDSFKNLWCSDNQGDWVATTPLYLLNQGAFYGHPSSLVWDNRWPRDRDPLKVYREDLETYNRHRAKPVVWLPHAELCRSGAGIIEIPRNKSFGAEFAGQLLLCDNNSDRLCRIMLDATPGGLQGAATLFVKGNGLRSGNNRLRFSPDGKTLYVGQTVRGWGKPSEGLQRITWKSGVPFDISAFEITPTGFRLTFTKELPDEASVADTYRFSSYTYQSRWTYGSDKEDRLEHDVAAVRQTSPKVVEVDLDGLAAGRVYQLDLPAMTAKDGSPLHNRLFCYTANHLK